MFEVVILNMSPICNIQFRSVSAAPQISGNCLNDIFFARLAVVINEGICSISKCLVTILVHRMFECLVFELACFF